MFYPKLAVRNLKKNGKMYLPYLLTCVLTIMMFYVMSAIGKNPGIQKMNGADSLQLMLSWSVGITWVFAGMFLFYTNSFLIKQRKKEFGLYQVLGMDKGNLSKMMIWESFITCFIALAVGLLLGLLLGKLMFLVLLKIIHFEVPLEFAIIPQSVLTTVALFTAIFLVTLVFNLFQVRRANPIELLHGGQQGEKEPRTKWVLAVLGFIALGSGYLIAQTVESPIAAINLFFVAVILVIVGTYMLFTAGSLALLKILKKNRSFYYQTRHFTAVSGMIYRMKQNAVGLANICILSTVVLVLISVTSSLYIGMEDIMHTRFPTDVAVYVNNTNEEKQTQVEQIITEELKKSGLTEADVLKYQHGDMTFTFDKNNKSFISDIDQTDTIIGVEDYWAVKLIPLADYNGIEGKNISLEKNQVLVYAPEDDFDMETFSIGDEAFHVKKFLDETKIASTNTMGAMKVIYFVLDDKQTVSELYEKHGYEGNNTLKYSYTCNLSGTDKEQGALAASINSRLTQAVPESGIEYRNDFRESFYKLYGGFLFLGIFVGALFLMATVLIIYYKQISEGYDDRDRYQIMQKVGMSHVEVKKSIRSQVLTVFFLPLVAAVVHVAVAFKVVTKLLLMLNLGNDGLTFLCTVGTIAVFSIFYGVVFWITSREYYKIVQ